MAKKRKIQKNQKKEREIPVLLRWFRAVGVVSILIGGFGLMTVFFWPSVIAVYLGAFICLIDLWYENFGKNKWIKVPVFIASVCLAVYFTKEIVLYKDPLFIVITKMSDTQLNVAIENDTQVNYEDANLTVRVRPQQCFIINAQQQSNIEGVTLLNVVPGTFENDDAVRTKAPLDGKYAVVVSQGGTNIITGLGWGETFTNCVSNIQRIHCDAIPHEDGIYFNFDFDSLPTNLTVICQYKGKFQQREVVQQFEIK